MGVEIHMGSTLAIERPYRRPRPNHGRPPSRSLTPAEAHVVALLIEGNNTKEIGAIRDCTQVTINMLLRNARNRTGCRTTCQLCAWYATRILTSEVIPA